MRKLADASEREIELGAGAGLGLTRRESKQVNFNRSSSFKAKGQVTFNSEITQSKKVESKNFLN